MARAITMAFKAEHKPANGMDIDGEEIIDTTKPGFAESFKGFINQPGISQQRTFPNRSTEIITG
jgi:hypothetical protein